MTTRTLAMTEQAQEYYVEIYGGPDNDPLTVDRFSAPRGGFLIGYLDGDAVALYRAAGYVDVEPFGFYAGSAAAVHLGKDL